MYRALGKDSSYITQTFLPLSGKTIIQRPFDPYNGRWEEPIFYSSDDNKLNFIGFLGLEAEASNYLLYPLYHDKYTTASHDPSWFPYTFFGSNDFIIGYETGNDYGMQIKMPHGEGKNYKRTRMGSKTWSNWVAL